MPRIFGGRRTGQVGTQPRKPIEVVPGGTGGADPSAQLASEPCGSALAASGCALRPQRHRIEVFIRDAGGDKTPLDGVMVRLTKASDETSDSIADAGDASFEGLLSGQYTIVLPGIDASLCSASMAPLPRLGFSDKEELMWCGPRALPCTETHIVQSGDCLASLAFEYGISVDAQKAANRDIKTPNLLVPGDKVAVAKLTAFTAEVAAGQRCIIDVAVPRIFLSMRMVSYGLKERGKVPFELQVFDADWSELDGRKGETNDSGEIKVPTQASARYARLFLRPKDGETEHYSLLIGELEPDSNASGLRARLNNLAFYGGEDPPPSHAMVIDGEPPPSHDPALQAALASFGTFCNGPARLDGKAHSTPSAGEVAGRHGS